MDLPGRPNVLVILVDDHAQWASHLYGNSELRTPSLEYLASTGLVMQNAFTPCPVCSPARASFFTGRIPSQHGIHDFIATGFPEYALGWMDREITLPQLLQDKGYETALLGKWHCTVDSATPQPGFDRWLSYDHDTAGWSNQYLHKGSVHFSDQGTRITVDGFQSRYLASQATEFLRNRDQSRPFFLYYAPVDTHSPFEGHPARLAESYGDAHFWDIPQEESTHLEPTIEWLSLESRAERESDEVLAQYYSAVTMVDDQVGTLLDELESQDLLDDTLIIYTADHGYMTGHHGLWGKGPATKPQNFYEEVVRIPYLMRWPGVFPENRRLSIPFDHCDMFATLVAATGPPLSDELRARINTPGQNLLAYLKGDGFPWRAHQFCEYGPAQMVTDLDYKLVVRYPPHRPRYPNELFHLSSDPRETSNRIDHPSQSAKIEELSGILDEHFLRFEQPDHSVRNILSQPPCNASDRWWPGTPSGI